MADINQTTQAGSLGPETTPGTLVATTFLPLSFGFTRMKQMGSGKMIRPQGYKVPTTSMPVGYRWTEWALSPDSVMDYGELPYLLCSAIKNVSPTSDGTNGKKWTFNITKNDIDTKKTYSFEQGNSQHAQRTTYAHMISLGMFMSRLEQGLSGNWRGQALADAITLSSPTSPTQRVISPQSFDVRIGSTAVAATGTQQVETATAVTTTSGAGNVTVTVTAAGSVALSGGKAIVVALASGDTASVWAGKVRTALAADADVEAFFRVGGSGTAITLTARAAAANDATMNIAIADTGSTGITPVVTSTNTTAGSAPASVYSRPFRVEFALDGIQDALPRMNSSDTSYISTQDLPLAPTIKLTTGADTADMAYLATHAAGDTTFIYVTSTGAPITGAASSNYFFSLLAACKINESYDPSEQNGTAQAVWPLSLVYDPTFNNIIEIVTINTLASL